MKILKNGPVQSGINIRFCFIATILPLVLSATASIAQVTRSTVRSGNWPNKNTWDCNCVPAATDDIVIKSGHPVTSTGGSRQMRNLTVETGGMLTSNSSNFISGNLIINGNYGGSGVMNLTGGGTTVSGTGTISNTGAINITGSKTILAGANLTRNPGNILINENTTMENFGALTVHGDVILNSNVTFNNYGTIAITGSLGGGATNISTRIFNNLENALLSVGVELLVTGASSTGLLNASASGNTVLYAGSAAQNINVPNTGQYHHLSFSGAGAKSLPPGDLFISGNFFNASVMVAGSGTVEFIGSTEIRGTIAPSFNDFVVGAGAVLTSYSGDLNIAGNFTDNGTFTHNNGTVVFNGTASAKLISGMSPLTSFRNITVNSSEGLSNTKAIEVYGVVNVGAGVTFDADGSGSGSMTLRSTSESTTDNASIGQLLEGAAITGVVRHERFMSARPRIYRYLSSPVQNATVGSWSDDFHITGNIPGLKKITLCGYSASPTSPSLFHYDESIPGDQLVGYLAYPIATGLGLNSPLVPGRGYAAFVRNCTPVVIKVDGVINSGDFIFKSVSYSSSGNVADGFNLVGNPYPSAIDWASAGGWDRVNIGSVAAITNNQSGLTQFEYLDASDFGPQVIAAGQGFWVQATAEGPSMAIHETAKTTEAGQFFRQRDTQQDHLIIKLSDGITTDKAYIKLRPFAAKGKDQYDGIKISNASFDLFVYAADGAELAIHSTPEINCGEPVRLGIRNLKPGNYRIDLEKFGKFGRMDFTLLDNFTGKKVKLEEHVFEFNVDKNKESAAINRFDLLIEEKVPSGVEAIQYNPLTCGNHAEIKVTSSTNGVEYRVLTETDSVMSQATGDGKAIVFVIPADQLSAGKNVYRVQTKSSCGAPPRTDSVTIVSAGVPDGFEFSSGKTCGPGVTELSVSQLEQNERVHWYSAELDDQPIFTGDKFITPALNKSRIYFGEVVNDAGCSSGRIPVETEVVWVDPVAIWMNGPNHLETSSENSSWYFNGEEIGSGQNITAMADGKYTVEVHVNGCIGRGAFELFLPKEVVLKTEVSIYPNPCSEFIEIMNPSGDKITSLRIVDEDGKSYDLSRISTGSDKQIFDIRAFAPGLYIVQISYDERTEVQKLIKL